MSFGKNTRMTSQIAIRRRPRQSRFAMTVDAIL
ncbi:hypothetical protein GGD68_002927 [Paraburkholderia fungorum]|uniref:Uncharacterized protein n=1 Tax=Paraburkholderia fungorum TaxID=134537 RepID=A0AAW3UX02_9BURK|nr:hypothetical protein [Paraburkholderia fungorum]MBB6202296.1 hypothetical protein [Paraburkholderia fungorum]